MIRKISFVFIAVLAFAGLSPAASAGVLPMVQDPGATDVSTNEEYALAQDRGLVKSLEFADLETAGKPLQAQQVAGFLSRRLMEFLCGSMGSNVAIVVDSDGDYVMTSCSAFWTR